jgi:arylsulfatase A-like enzyme
VELVATGPFYFSPYHSRSLPDGPDGEYRTDRLTSEAISVIKKWEDDSKPWFVYLPYCSVHAPITAKPETIAKYAKKGPGKQGKNNCRFAAMLEHLDENVGRLMDHLEASGQAKNTLIIFFSDNGGKATAQTPLRGRKGQIYEGGIRVPLIIRYPGLTAPGSRCDTSVISTDLYPTLLDFIEAPLQPKQYMDGVSVVPLLKGERIARDAVYFHYPHYCLQHDGYPAGAIRQGHFKLIQFFEDDRLELYNLKDDIGENHNLAKEMPEKVEQLHEKLLAWQKNVGAAMPKHKHDPNAEPDDSKKDGK